MKKPNLGSLQRRFVSLLISLIFLVMAITGVLAFVLPFSLRIIGLHALVGFLFIVIVGFHVANNIRPLKGYLHSRAIWVTLAITVLLSLVIWQRPSPVRALMGLSGNLGPAQEKLEISEGAMVFHYNPAPSYRMQLTVKTGAAFDAKSPPSVAIWLENQGAYHIKTLLAPESSSAESLPYWGFKHEGWQKAREEAEELEVDAITEPTPNGSFDPADYILPADPENPMPYQLLIEIDQSGDEQPSLIYSVTIDNADPRTFQLLDIVGYPKRENDSDGKEAWALFYVDERFTSALDLIDSALLMIERK